MNGQKRNFTDLVKESFFVYWLSRFADFIYKSLACSLIGGFFLNYDKETSATKNSAILSFIKRIFSFGGIGKKFKQTMLKACEQSLFLCLLNKMFDSLLYSSVKVYGIFVFSSGIYTTIVYFLSQYAFRDYAKGFQYLLCGILMVLCSIPMFFCSDSLAKSILNSRIMSPILFGLMGIHRERFEQQREAGGKSNIAFIAGILFGLAGLAISPLSILIGIIGIVVAAMLIVNPETGTVVLFLALPFLSTMQLVALVAYISVCFFLKLIRGKRTLKFHIIDLLVLAFMLLMALGGIVSVTRAASIKSAMVFVCFMIGYFLIVNLVKTGEWVRRCVISLAISSFAVSVYGLYENFFAGASSIWLDKEMFSDISGRVVSTFENPNVLAEYLIMVLPFVFSLIIISKSRSGKFASFICALACCACLVYTWSRGAWLGFAAAMIIYLLILSKKSMILMGFGVLALPFLPLVLPVSIVNRITSIGNLGDTSTAYRVNIWKGAVNLAGDYWASGIGIGTAAFGRVYPKYALSGIESAPHAHNLYLQILVEIGVVGLLVFLCLILVFGQSCFSFYRRGCCESDYASRRAKIISAAGFCGIIAVLLQGMTDYIWYNYRVFLMFWLVIGLVVAVRRGYLFEKPGKAYLESSIELPYKR